MALARIYTTPNDPQKLPNTAIVFVKGHFLLTLDSSDPAAVNNAVDDDLVTAEEDAAAAPPLRDKIEAPLCRNRRLLLLPLPLPPPPPPLDDIIVEAGVAANGGNAAVVGWNVTAAEAGDTTVEIAGDTIMERERGRDDVSGVAVGVSTTLLVGKRIGNPKTKQDGVLLLPLLLKRIILIKTNNNKVTVTPLDVSGEDMTGIEA